MKKSEKAAKPKPKAAPAKKPAAAKKPAKAKKSAPAVEVDVHKFEAARPAKAPTAAKSRTPKGVVDLDNLGELPRSYGDVRIFVVAQEPHWLFCYWDHTLTDGLKGRVFLRHFREGSDVHEGEAEVPAETNSWYLAVKAADARYRVEIGLRDGRGWRSLAKSGPVLTPRDSLGGLGDPVFANMPFHLTFQDLVEKLRGEMAEGESLAEALARLQERGDLPLAHLTTAQRTALDTLLGTQLGSLTSGDLGRFLSSPGGEASLFSGGFAPSSWSSGGASWTSGASWTEAPGGVSSSFLALFGLVGASWSSGPQSSALASWSMGALSSWTVLSSWAGLTSWPGVTSWGAETSWSSALGASWSAQPFSQPPPRDFFMHVNAEVIFYGGTHPDARVTIAGNEVALRPDGSFRFHFVFPDGEFEIPVVATSPDGVETRRAVLRFERGTEREGDVGSTAQPPLKKPMGRKR